MPATESVLGAAVAGMLRRVHVLRAKKRVRYGVLDCLSTHCTPTIQCHPLHPLHQTLSSLQITLSFHFCLRQFPRVTSCSSPEIPLYAPLDLSLRGASCRLSSYGTRHTCTLVVISSWTLPSYEAKSIYKFCYYYWGCVRVSCLD